MLQVAVIDDWQDVARNCADWRLIESHAQVQFFTQSFKDANAAANQLRDADVIVPMRERTQFTRDLLQQLPRLKLLALTGMGTRHVDIDYCNQHRILCCGSGAMRSPAATAELALALMLAAARRITAADAALRHGRFQEGIGFGTVLEGKTLGVIGLGRIGSRVASYGRALGMQVLAWSQNLSDEQAHQAGVKRVTKDELLQQSDVISLHLMYSERSRHTLGGREFALMKPGAIVVNTARGPLIDEAALLDCLRTGRVVAALDVYDQEPLPLDHPLRSLSNTVLTPHLGFNNESTFREFYTQSVENILAYINGSPLRVLNADALRGG